MFKKLEADVAADVKDLAKLKDTVLLMSHKLLAIADWKAGAARDLPKLKQKVEKLYEEHAKAEAEVAADILRPDDLHLDVDIKPQAPVFPNMSMLVRDDSVRTIKIDDLPPRALPELISPRARRLGPITVRHNRLPGVERFDTERKVKAVDPLGLKKRRNTLMPAGDLSETGTRLKPVQRARLNNLIAAQMARDRRQSESVEFIG